MSGKSKIIIGTKISVLLPFCNLSKIIVIDEQNWNHKQSDINPRFDARQIAEWLAKNFSAKLILTTPAPSVENFSEKLKRKKVNPSADEAGKKKSNLKLIDLKMEKFKGNYTFLSDELIYQIQANLEEKKKILILHNRKGLANYVFCKECGHVFKCPECQISLVYSTSNKKLSCPLCNYSEEILPLCPKCSGPNIMFKGQGVEKIKNELQKEFSQAEVLILEKSTRKDLNTKTSKNYDIVIGTEFVINKINFAEFDLIAFTNFDQLLNRPDFRTQERAYQVFYTIKSQAPKSYFIIQTNQPDNVVLQSIKDNLPDKFYKSELENRKILNYPPFCQLIKIIAKDLKQKNVEYKSKKLVLDLQKKLDKTIEVLGPFENFPQKEFNKYVYNIILKAPLNFSLPKIFKIIPNDFIIDANPEKLN